MGSGLTLDSGVPDICSVYALAFDSKNNLYAGGNFDTAGDVSANCIAKWDGTKWSTLGLGVTIDSSSNIVASVNSITFDASDNLYAGGYFGTAGDVSANNIAKWDGTKWSSLGNGLKLYNDGYFKNISLVFDKNSNTLYAGGYFGTAGDVSANNIAQWYENEWSPLGTGVDTRIFSLALDSSNNTLYLGGFFKKAGGVSVSNIASVKLNFKNYLKNTDGSNLYLKYSGEGSVTNLLYYDETSKVYNQVN